MSPIEPVTLATVAHGLIAAHEATDKIIDAYEHGGLIHRAFGAAQRRRLSRLLRAIDFANRDYTEEEHQKFRELLETEPGQDLLLDFAQTTVRTESKIAVAALGLLYSTRDGQRYPPTFKRLACEALEGISDEAVVLFLDLLGLAESIMARGRTASSPDWIEVEGGRYSTSGPYLRVHPDENQAAERLNRAIGELIVMMHHLTNRGLILPIPRTGGYGGDPPLTIGIGEDTRRFQRLLGDARLIIDE